MNKWKKTGKALLFPHMALLWILLPIAAGFLVYSMVFLGTESPIAIGSYVLAAYTLTLWCCRIPKIISFFRNFKNENKYIRLWTGDVRLRMNISLLGGFIWNGVYSVFQLWLGVYHGSFWYCSMAAYYFCLAVMRFSLSMHTKKHAPGTQIQRELRKYRTCGWVLLAMNLALGLMVFFMIYWNRTFHHHQITTIAMAAYTFTTFTVAIINTVKYRKYKSPVFSASKAISLAAACVSMITLTSTMLTAFGQGEDLLLRRLMLGLLGGAVSAFIIAMAIYMIRRANKQLRS